MSGMSEALKHYLESGQLIAFPIVFIGGVLASFTPCIYPVIPITIGYIGAKAAGSKIKGFVLSLSYVIGISITYSILGAIAALTGMLFGQLSSNPWSYFIIGNICILLGLSMLLGFELRIPVFWKKSPFKITSYGILPALTMGLVSGIIMSPCTAPILAALLAYVAAKQNLLYGISLLFTYALGMGVLLIILGTFTGLLVSMPKAGRWLEKIKKGFGGVLIITGGYFLFIAVRLTI